MPRRAIRALAAVLLTACAGAAGGPRDGTLAQPTALAITTSAPPTKVEVTASAYGRVVISTDPGTPCTVRIHIGAPKYGDLPPPAVDGTADAAGALTVSYPTPHLPATTGWHEVTCGTGTANADFSIPSTPVTATHFTARIRVVAIDEQITGVTSRSDPALVPLRDNDVAALQRSLAADWSVATRGLSTLELVAAAPADIVLTVVAARDTPVMVTASDGSQGIFLYVAEQRTTFSGDNFVAVALHELGHLWCCNGPGSDGSGHWATPVADPLLGGVDRYGLMNHPVQCYLIGAIESCPNRFSDRELRTMGFDRIPPPR